MCCNTHSQRQAGRSYCLSLTSDRALERGLDRASWLGAKTVALGVTWTPVKRTEEAPEPIPATLVAV